MEPLRLTRYSKRICLLHRSDYAIQIAPFPGSLPTIASPLLSGRLGMVPPLPLNTVTAAFSSGLAVSSHCLGRVLSPILLCTNFGCRPRAQRRKTKKPSNCCALVLPHFPFTGRTHEFEGSYLSCVAALDKSSLRSGKGLIDSTKRTVYKG